MEKKKKKLLFNSKKKCEVLKGRTGRYLARNKVACSEVHLNNILNGKMTCSYLLAKNIVECVSPEAEVKDFFIEV